MPTMREIAEQVGKSRGLSQKSMWDRTRIRHIAYARQEAFYKMIEAGHGCYKVARFWGYCHTTVLHGAAQHAKINNLPPVTTYDIDAHLAQANRAAQKSNQRRRHANA